MMNYKGIVVLVPCTKDVDKRPKFKVRDTTLASSIIEKGNVIDASVIVVLVQGGATVLVQHK